MNRKKVIISLLVLGLVASANYVGDISAKDLVSKDTGKTRSYGRYGSGRYGRYGRYGYRGYYSDDAASDESSSSQKIQEKASQVQSKGQTALSALQSAKGGSPESLMSFIKSFGGGGSGSSSGYYY